MHINVLMYVEIYVVSVRRRYMKFASPSLEIALIDTCATKHFLYHISV